MAHPVSSTHRRPSRAPSSTSRRRYGLFIDGEFVDGTGGGRSRRSTRPPRRSSPRSPRRAPPTSMPRRGGRAPRLRPRVVADARAASAASTSSASRGSSRSARASSRCWRRLDNGKPIKESRDVDVPLAAAHFFYYAGWADKLEYAGFGPDPTAARRRRPGHPVELPAAHAGVEDRPGPGRAATPWCSSPPRPRRSPRCCFAEICQQADLPAGRRQHRHRRRRHRAARSSRTPTSTRSPSPARPRSARRSPGRSPAPARSSPSSSAARPPTSCSTTPRSTRPSRASSTASSSTRATSAAPARACWCRRTIADERRRAAQAPAVDAARRRPARQEHRHRRDQLRASSSSAIRAPRRRRRRRGRRALDAPLRPPRARASGSRRRSSPASRSRTASRARRSSARCSRCSPSARPTEAIEKANNTPYGLSAGIWTDKGSRILMDGRPAARRRGVGQHVQPVRPDQPRSAATRSRATAARAAATASRPTST